jgi:hypothetical protein
MPHQGGQAHLPGIMSPGAAQVQQRSDLDLTNTALNGLLFQWTFLHPRLWALSDTLQFTRHVEELSMEPDAAIALQLAEQGMQPKKLNLNTSAVAPVLANQALKPMLEKVVTVELPQEILSVELLRVSSCTTCHCSSYA